MIQQMTERIVGNLIDNRMIKEEYRESYEYAVLCQIEQCITMGSILLLAVFLRQFVPTICFLMSFFPLRKRTGGFHMNTFVQCYFGTIAVYLCVLFLKSFVRTGRIIVFLTAVSAVYIMFVGCVNHTNMQLDRDELVEMKKSARSVLCLLVLIIGFEVWLDVSGTIVYCTSMGIIVCAVLLVIEKIKGGGGKYEQEISSKGD